MIEIELAKDGKKFKQNLVIRCTIKREGNKTAFSVDGKPQSKKAVIELCRSLSIQIDNLCQFLPQDKVVEFAAMTPVELLRSTQRAVASQEMIETHEELKDLRKKQKDAQNRCTADQETLTNLEGRQRLQEADVERMREREQVEKRVTMLEAARPFAAYRGARIRHLEAKDKKKNAQDELTRLQNEVEPSLRALNAKEDYRDEIKAALGERKKVVTKAEQKADGIDREFRDLQDKHNELLGKYDAERKGGLGSRNEIRKLEGQIFTLKRQMEEQPPELDVQTYNERIREKRRAAESCQAQIKDLQDQQRECKRKGNEKSRRIQQARQDLENLDSQTGKQNSKLQGFSSDTARLWEWVQQHQGDFEKPVFGPPIVSCSVKDPKYVDHIESLFMRRVMLTITVQTNSDLKRLSIASRDLGTKDTYIQTMWGSVNDFPAPVGEDEMKRFGFDLWALDLLEGPETVLAMLCYDRGIHRTGISLRDTTTQQFQLLEASPVQAWATGKSVYNITHRREYGSDGSSTRVQPVKPGAVWTEAPVNLTAKRELEELIQEWSDEINTIKVADQDARTKIDNYRIAMVKAAEEEKELAAEKAAKQKALGEFKALPTKLAALEEKMKSCQEAIAGVRDRLRAIQDQQHEIATQRGHVAIAYADAVEALRASHNSLHEAEIMLIEATSDCEVLEERNRSVKDLLETQEREVRDLGKETQTFRAEAQKALAECQQLLSTDNEDEELKTFFKSLPEGQTADELEGEIESEKARLELMHEGNGGIIREYEKRKKNIDALAARVEDIKDALAELDERIKVLRDQWEPELDSLVEKISRSFSINMEEISCAGEVGVCKDEDFDQWAIQIRVKFR